VHLIFLVESGGYFLCLIGMGDAAELMFKERAPTALTSDVENALDRLVWRDKVDVKGKINLPIESDGHEKDMDTVYKN
jgi:hypothetical protein